MNKKKAKLIKKSEVPTYGKRQSVKAEKPKLDSFSAEVRVKISGRGSEASAARKAWKKLFGG